MNLEASACVTNCRRPPHGKARGLPGLATRTRASPRARHREPGLSEELQDIVIISLFPERQGMGRWLKTRFPRHKVPQETMKLATLRDGGRDGRLLVVRRDGEAGAPSPDAWPTLQRALDDWAMAEPALRTIADELDRGEIDGIPVDPG